MSLSDRPWSVFAIEVEVENVGVSRLCLEYNRVRLQNEQLQADCRRKDEALREIHKPQERRFTKNTRGVVCAHDGRHWPCPTIQALAPASQEQSKKHRYPDPDGTSDCLNGCGAWLGPFNSGGPPGIDPFGDCPKAASQEPAAQPWKPGPCSACGGPHLACECCRSVETAQPAALADHPFVPCATPGGACSTMVRTGLQDDKCHWWFRETDSFCGRGPSEHPPAKEGMAVSTRRRS